MDVALSRFSTLIKYLLHSYKFHSFTVAIFTVNLSYLQYTKIQCGCEAITLFTISFSHCITMQLTVAAGKFRAETRKFPEITSHTS